MHKFIRSGSVFFVMIILFARCVYGNPGGNENAVAWNNGHGIDKYTGIWSNEQWANDRFINPGQQRFNQAIGQELLYITWSGNNYEIKHLEFVCGTPHGHWHPDDRMLGIDSTRDEGKTGIISAEHISRALVFDDEGRLYGTLAVGRFVKLTGPNAEADAIAAMHRADYLCRIHR